MQSAIIVMYPGVEKLVDDFEGQSIGMIDVAVFPGSRKQEIQTRLHQQSASSNLTILEFDGLVSKKIGMASPMPDGGDNVLDAIFPNARSFF